MRLSRVTGVDSRDQQPRASERAGGGKRHCRAAEDSMIRK